MDEANIINFITKLGYKKDHYGYTKGTENTRHWVTIFLGGTVQVYGYPHGNPENENTYDTGIIKAATGTLKLLIKSFLYNHS